MPQCVRCRKKMYNYSIKYADIIYKLSLCWRPECKGYFQIVPEIDSPLTDSISRNPMVIMDLLASKALKPIL